MQTHVLDVTLSMNMCYEPANLTLISVKLTNLRLFLCFLRSISCGKHISLDLLCKSICCRFIFTSQKISYNLSSGLCNILLTYKTNPTGNNVTVKYSVNGQVKCVTASRRGLSFKDLGGVCANNDQQSTSVWTVWPKQDRQSLIFRWVAVA